MNEVIVNFTCYKSVNPLTKEYLFNKETNTIENINNFKYSKGYAYFKSIAFSDLPQVLKSSDKYTAITSGVYSEKKYGEKVECLTRKALEVNVNAIARTKKYINHENNPDNGLVILDIDEPRNISITSPDEFYTILCRIIPGFKSVPCFTLGSCSSRIEGLDKNGYKLYFPTNTPICIPKFSEWLHKTLCLAGHIRIEVAKNGTPHEKSIIDKAMGAPNQLDYCGEPVLNEGLKRRKQTFKWHAKKGACLNLSSFIALSAEDGKVYRAEMTKVSERSAIKSQEIRQQFNAELELNIKKLGINLDEAKKELSIYPVTIKNGAVDLASCFPLFFNDGRIVSVAEVLANMDAFDGKALADPIEGVGYGSQCAKFYSNKEAVKPKPFINSHAHGLTQYFLKYRIKPGYSKKVDELNNKVAVQTLNKEVDAVFQRIGSRDENGGVTNAAIIATVGLGKTRSIFTAAKAMKDAGKSLLVHLYVPTHKVAEDIFSNMTRIFPDLAIAIQKGRSADNCDNYSHIDKYPSTSIRSFFCDNGKGDECRFLNTCQYMKQFDKSVKVDVLILPHSYLATHQQSDERRPHLVVIDESFYEILVGHDSLRASELKGVINDNAMQVLHSVIEAEPKSLKGFFDLLGQHWGAAEIQALRSYENKWDKVKRHAIISPSDCSNEIKKKQQVLGKVNKKQYLLVKELLKRFDLWEKHSHLGKKDFTLLNGEIHFHRHHMNINDFKSNRMTSFLGFDKNGKEYKNIAVPILYIDGTGNSDIVKRMLGARAKLIEINAKRNLFVTQCHSSMFSKAEAEKTGSELHRAWAVVINRVAESNFKRYQERTLLVTYKSLENDKNFRGKLSKHVEVEHFKNIRGLDKYSQYHVIILGRHQINTHDIIINAIDLFGYQSDFSEQEHTYIDNAVDDSFGSRDVYYLMDGGEPVVGSENYFSYQPFNVTMMQHRENESTQGLARIRDVWSEHKKNVLILSSLALDVTVNHTLSWPELNVKGDESILMAAFEASNGILIQSASLMRQLEGIPGFPSVKEKKWKKILEHQKRYIFPMGEYEKRRVSYRDRLPIEHKYESTAHLGIDIVKMKIKLKKVNRSLTLVYDTASFSEQTAIDWVEETFGEIEDPYMLESTKHSPSKNESHEV